jgi:CheY-like chemotaxis protein
MVRSQPDAPTVMVAEDTDAVRIVLRMQLIILGYRVLEASQPSRPAAVISPLSRLI